MARIYTALGSWLLTLAVSVPGLAQQAPASIQLQGHVITLENGDIVVDLAGKKGARPGDVVELWRPLRLRHPVTRQYVTDRFKIGALRLTQVRDNLALARPEGKLQRPPRAGDVVLLTKAPPAPTPVPGPGVAKPEAPSVIGPVPSASDPETERVRKLFDDLKGASITKRIRAYEGYVTSTPNAPYAVVLYEEAAALRRLLSLEESEQASTRPGLVSFAAPLDAVSGARLQVGVEVRDAVGAVLHTRHSGEVAYQSAPMQAAGTGYFVAPIEGARMQAPSVAYFIEAVDERGIAHPVVGSSEDPRFVSVEAAPQAKPAITHDTTASVWTDYADWNNMEGNDWAWQTEGFMGMRFNDVGFRALRTGFGVFRGAGGSLEELDQQNLEPRPVGLTYGYVEAEFGLSNFTGLVTRGVVGLGDAGVAGGAQFLVRFGNDKSTNLLMGGEVLQGVGLRGITQMELAIFEKFPILLRTEVTNQPAGTAGTPPDPPSVADPTVTPPAYKSGDVGARAIAQVGYRVLPELTIAARGSYQGRTINHAGPGFGGAVTYSW